jgi:molybdenum cofactor biosynthesis enzyme MoaA
MNEQRVSDLIEWLQRFDGDTRIEGYVSLKWNDKRTAIVATEDNLIEKLDDRDSTIATLRGELDGRDGYVEELEKKIEDLELELKEIGELDA